MHCQAMIKARDVITQGTASEAVAKLVIGTSVPTHAVTAACVSSQSMANECQQRIQEAEQLVVTKYCDEAFVVACLSIVGTNGDLITALGKPWLLCLLESGLSLCFQ